MEYFIALIYIYLNLNSSFSELYGSPVTVNMKLYVTTVNNSFLPLPIFCHKELHLTGYIGHDLNILKGSTQILKDIGGDQVHPSETMKSSHS